MGMDGFWLLDSPNCMWQAHYLVVWQSQLGVTSTWFAEWAYWYNWWQLQWIHCTLDTDRGRLGTSAGILPSTCEALNFSTASPECVEEVAVDRAGCQVCPGNIFWSRLGWRDVLMMAVTHIYTFLQSLQLKILWPVTSVVNRPVRPTSPRIQTGWQLSVRPRDAVDT